MTWDLGLVGAGLLALMSLLSGAVAHLVWWRVAPHWLWAAAAGAFFAFGVVVSEWWFGWATQEELQPNVDGLSFDEVLLLGCVLPLAVVAVARAVTRRHVRTARPVARH